MIRETNLRHAQFYAHHTGQKQEAFEREMNLAKSLSSRRALELGFIDRVLDTSGIIGVDWLKPSARRHARFEMLSACVISKCSPMSVPSTETLAQ